MAARFFLDTNILVYAAAAKNDAPEKHAVANRIVSEGEYLISGQVLGEFYHNVRYLQHEMMSAAKAQEWVSRFEEYCAVQVDTALVQAAMFIRERFKIQFWDAALIAACHRLNLPILYSEDMNHGQKYGPVIVINPFKAHH
jgi:predicted nucleic acid-binding protein